MASLLHMSRLVCVVAMTACASGPGSKDIAPSDEDGSDSDGEPLSYSVETVQDFCATLTAVVPCARAFDGCGPALAGYGNVNDCVAGMTQSRCGDIDWDDVVHYDAAAAAICVDDAIAADCATAPDELPESCQGVIEVSDAPNTEGAPSTDGCIAATAGSLEGTIADTDLEYVWDGYGDEESLGYADIYCLALISGDALTITLGPPAEDENAILDTVALLFDGEGTLIAWNDDIDYEAGDYYSAFEYGVEATGGFMLVVLGWDTDTVGDYQLTVAIE